MRGLGSLIVRVRRIPRLDSRGAGKIRRISTATTSSLFGGEDAASCSTTSRSCSNSYLRSWKWNQFGGKWILMNGKVAYVVYFLYHLSGDHRS